MSFDTTISRLETYQSHNNTIPYNTFNTLFAVLENGADGNCLFESIEQLNNTFTHAKLRKQVCDYYKTFDTEQTYEDDSLEERLKIQMSVDNIEYHATTGKELKRTHDKKICVNKTYAGMMDIFVIAMLLRSNIVLLNGNEEDNFTVQPIKFANDAPIMFIKFNGVDHYEALNPKNPKTLNNATSKKGRRRATSRSRSPKRSSSTKKHSSSTKKSSSSTKKHSSLTKKHSSSTKKHSISPTLLLASLRNEIKYNNDLGEKDIKVLNEKIKTMLNKNTHLK